MRVRAARTHCGTGEWARVTLAFVNPERPGVRARQRLLATAHTRFATA
jgi:hypothetical protein